MADSNSARPRFAGRQVTLGGIEYTIAPLNVGALKRLAPQFQSMATLVGLPTIEQWDDMLAVFLAAFHRNYPEMTKEQLEDLVDVGNFAEIAESVMRVSGLVKREGESQPGAASS
jgi:hypothetical protein